MYVYAYKSLFDRQGYRKGETEKENYPLIHSQILTLARAEPG